MPTCSRSASSICARIRQGIVATMAMAQAARIQLHGRARNHGGAVPWPCRPRPRAGSRRRTTARGTSSGCPPSQVMTNAASPATSSRRSAIGGRAARGAQQRRADQPDERRTRRSAPAPRRSGESCCERFRGRRRGTSRSVRVWRTHPTAGRTRRGRCRTPAGSRSSRAATRAMPTRMSAATIEECWLPRVGAATAMASTIATVATARPPAASARCRARPQQRRARRRRRARRSGRGRRRGSRSTRARTR